MADVALPPSAIDFPIASSSTLPATPAKTEPSLPANNENREGRARSSVPSTGPRSVHEQRVTRERSLAIKKDAPNGENGDSRATTPVMRDRDKERELGIIGGNGKKRRQKGWKGWAMVIEDEAGNIIEYQEPPLPAVVPVHTVDQPRDISAPADETVQHVENTQQSVHTAPPENEPSHQSTLSPNTVQNVLEDIANPASTSQSPAASDTPSALHPPPDTKRKRRDSVPSVMVNSRASSSKPPQKGGPRHSLPKAKLPKSARGTAPARTQPARRPQPAGAHPEPAPEPDALLYLPYDYDGVPLPAAPRTGMGDGYPSPPESDLRVEAKRIIADAAKHRKQRQMLANRPARMTTPSLPMPLPGPPQNGKHIDGNRELNGHIPLQAGPLLSPPPSNSTTASNHRGHLSHQAVGEGHENGDISDLLSEITSPPTSPPKYTLVKTDYRKFDFASAWAAVEKAYERGNGVATPDATASSASPLPVYGKDEVVFENRQAERLRVSSILNHPTQPESLPAIDAKQGLPIECAPLDSSTEMGIEQDAAGFVNNVGRNLQSILFHYFPQPSARRDAFLRKVGQGLMDLGTSVKGPPGAA